MSEDVEWETRRRKLIHDLVDRNVVINLRDLYHEMGYSNKKEMIDELFSIYRSLKSKGHKLKLIPAYCIHCGFRFSADFEQLSIPSRCPKCKSERIHWPSIQLKK